MTSSAGAGNKREKSPTTHDIATQLRERGLRYEMQDVPSRPQAFEKVASIVEALPDSLMKIHREGGLWRA